MQAKFSATNDCLHFPQVTSGKIHAPAGNLDEASIVRVTVDSFNPRDISFYPVLNNLIKVNLYCF